MKAPRRQYLVEPLFRTLDSGTEEAHPVNAVALTGSFLSWNLELS